MSIRDYITNNFKDSSIDDIKSSITSSINDKEEITLPGLGVLFEILWSNCSSKQKEDILGILKNNLI